MVKTYSRRIFGGKDSTWIGIDQGKSPLYPSALSFSLNAEYDGNAFKTRDGQAKVALGNISGILCGKTTGTQISIGSGTEVFVEEIG